MASTAGELRDITTAFELVDSALDADRRAIAELQRRFALLADVQGSILQMIGTLERSQKANSDQIEAFREGINEQFRRLREGIK
jgi:hypothetical protein